MLNVRATWQSVSALVRWYAGTLALAMAPVIALVALVTVVALVAAANEK